ncbi:TetR/AcrR family transcriptional regulator [Phytohabitans aurantiacus]|uniref:TetR/AcrR family transcriptional regulator n=1 Tax=Phytohabitans aurantiacus TaxID=3016789 RepID=UPI00249019C8|nr:TetR/AcrR family transcriptional regulator [Phytohabitans aurantiacus]
MSPRRSVEATAGTHAAILAHGAAVASVEGLSGLTIGRLAADLGMSKSGLLGHFGTKESLQLEVVDAAAAVFTREVADRAAGTAPGLPRLRALCTAWLSYLERGVFPGGCFFIAAATEFDDRDGPVRDAIAGLAELWHRDLRIQARQAIAAGELPAGTDPEQLVFDLTGVMLAAHHGFRLRRTPAAAYARHTLSHLLPPPPSAPASPPPPADQGQTHVV